MDSEPNRSLTIPLKLPVRVLKIGGLPKLMAGGMPVIPFNVALRQRRDVNEATEASLDTYARAAKLYVEFTAHLRQSILDITNDDFKVFRRALTGQSFRDADGNSVQLSGDRGNGTANNMITSMYSLAIDIEEIYRVRFDWRRYRGFPNSLIDYLIRAGSHTPPKGIRREHSIKSRSRKVRGLPDEQFTKLLCAAHEKWGNSIPDGDAAFAKDPGRQRGALFYRNSAILLVQRYGGARRSEVSTIELDSIDRENSKLYLVTKGHRGANEERLPVLLFPAVYDILWSYITRFRPVTDNQTEEDKQSVFLSHSVVNYGQRVTAETIRKIVEVMRPSLDPPWDKILTPQMLRHSWAYDLQRYLGEVGVMVNMRHRSQQSIAPYKAGIETFADVLFASINPKLEQQLAQTNFKL
jgi:integrase